MAKTVSPPRAVSRPWGRWWSWIFLAAAVGCALLAAHSGLGVWRAREGNRQMTLGTMSPGAPARVVLAHAIALEKAGRLDDALGAYAEAELLGGESVRQAVRVNVANLHLRRGIQAARDDGNAQRAITMLQLAKLGYRRALRAQPEDWDARYNLELALRMLPDFEARDWRGSGNQTEIEDRLLKDKAAWTEMVGQPRGMH